MDKRNGCFLISSHHNVSSTGSEANGSVQLHTVAAKKDEFILYLQFKKKNILGHLCCTDC